MSAVPQLAVYVNASMHHYEKAYHQHVMGRLRQQCSYLKGSSEAVRLIIEYFIYAANLTVRRKASKRHGCVYLG